VTVAARISLASVVQESTSGSFPSLTTYPANYEEIVAGEHVLVFAASGILGENAVTLNVPGMMAKVTHIVIENEATRDADGDADVAVAGGPLPVTVPRGQVAFATNAVAGWNAEQLVVTGTPGTPYKVICLGR
jgi:hypothetical protein